MNISLKLIRRHS